MMANISLQTQQNTNLQSIMQVSNGTTTAGSVANKVLIGGHSHPFASHHHNHHHHRHTLTFPNLETLFGTSTSSTNGSSHSILTPTTNATIINGNKIVVRPVISNSKLNKSSTLARIQQITKCPEHSSPSIESSNNGVYSTITSGNGNLVLYSSNICPSTRSLINNTNRVINSNNSSTVKHIPNPTLLTQKTDIGTITNDQMKPRSASNTNLPDTASPISRKRTKLNTVECTQSLSTNAKCQIKGVKVKDDEEIQVSINPKSIFFTSSNVQKVHNQQITNNNSKTLDTLKLNKSTNDQNNTGNSVQNQQSVNTTRFVGIVNRLNSYHNETVRYSFH